MSAEHIIDAMADIDEDLIQSAEAFRESGISGGTPVRPPVKKIPYRIIYLAAAMAACALIAAAVGSLGFLRPKGSAAGAPQAAPAEAAMETEEAAPAAEEAAPAAETMAAGTEAAAEDGVIAAMDTEEAAPAEAAPVMADTYAAAEPAQEAPGAAASQSMSAAASGEYEPAEYEEAAAEAEEAAYEAPVKEERAAAESDFFNAAKTSAEDEGSDAALLREILAGQKPVSDAGDAPSGSEKVSAEGYEQVLLDEKAADLLPAAAGALIEEQDRTAWYEVLGDDAGIYRIRVEKTGEETVYTLWRLAR